MALDLNIEAEKTDEQKLAEIKRSIFTMVRMPAIQIRNSRDNVRKSMLENDEFDVETIRAYIGEADCAILDEIDEAVSALLAKVIIEKPQV